MKHKIFISYYHKSDFKYREKFEKIFSNQFDIIISHSVKLNEIGNVGTEEFRKRIREKHLKESTVTIVLIGNDTWRRKHVDYEIHNTLRETNNNKRSGLIGIYIPTYQYPKKNINLKTIPKRLYQNLETQYANIYSWSEDPKKIKKWIHEAFVKRNKIVPNNSMLIMKSNWKGDGWS